VLCDRSFAAILQRRSYTSLMKFRGLGRSGVQVSQLCFGTMSFGGDADEAMSARMYRACRDLGINFFDTADQYGKGRSEEILGDLMRGERDALIVATKCFNPIGDDVNARGGSRSTCRSAVAGRRCRRSSRCTAWSSARPKSRSCRWPRRTA
jgi:aryl-alcohol dehydrogenase-like predicted oxidoreductase